jgi:hypothetical protein
MNLEDKVAISWMDGFTREPYPDRVVWQQSTVTHDSSYWLAVPKEQAKPGQLVVASRTGQEIRVEKATGPGTLTVLLTDAMLDLDKPVVVSMDGKKLFDGVVPRTVRSLQSTLAARGDKFLMFDGSVDVSVN